MLGDKEVLEAVQGHVGKRGEALPEPLPGDSTITWHSLLKARVVRTVESRSEDRRFCRGPIDLSDRPVYDTLSGYRVPKPQDPAKPRTWKLVRRGSVDDRLCACGNGQVRCQRCEGAGRIRCEPRQSCASCKDSTRCLLCDGAGRSALRPSRTPAATSTPHATGHTVDRIRCYECGEPDVACSACRGRGSILCTLCQGDGSRPCPDCAGDGKVTHEYCAGTGRTVEWIEGIITHTPKTDEIKLPEPGTLPWARKLADQHATWTQTTLVNSAPLPALVHQDFGSALKPLLRPHPQEIARRTELTYVRFAKVALAKHPHRIYYVFPTLSQPKVVVQPSAKRAWQIAGIVTGVVLLLVLISRIVA